MTKLLQCLRDELVRRDYAATTIRSYIQIIEAFSGERCKAARHGSESITSTKPSTVVLDDDSRWP